MALDISIAELRKEYRQKTLLEKEVSANPLIQFKKWWDEAVQSKIDEVNAMALATCNSKGRPAARMVLLKGFSEQGFIFFTNYGSKKGKDLTDNPYAALVFFWKELERQIRIEGSVKKISDAESDEYFLLRPAGSRLGAWSSPQSKPIRNREVLETNLTHYQQEFSHGEVPRPDYWGGYIVKAEVIEFWQGRPDRLHDRLQYTAGEAGWQIARLAP